MAAALWTALNLEELLVAINPFYSSLFHLDKHRGLKLRLDFPTALLALAEGCLFFFGVGGLALLADFRMPGWYVLGVAIMSGCRGLGVSPVGHIHLQDGDRRWHAFIRRLAITFCRAQARSAHAAKFGALAFVSGSQEI